MPTCVIATDNLSTQEKSDTLGLLPLTALVVGPMIGGGVFSLQQNMARGASAGAITIGWFIPGIGMLPEVFAKENDNGSPSGALWITSVCVQIVLIVTLYANSAYRALFYIAPTAILVPYVFSGAYLMGIGSIIAL